jgi:hypothetical protein
MFGRVLDRLILAALCIACGVVAGLIISSSHF